MSLKVLGVAAKLGSNIMISKVALVVVIVGIMATPSGIDHLLSGGQDASLKGTGPVDPTSKNGDGSNILGMEGIANGGFETGDMSGWTASGKDSIVTGGSQRTGTYAARVGPPLVGTSIMYDSFSDNEYTSNPVWTTVFTSFFDNVEGGVGSWSAVEQCDSSSAQSPFAVATPGSGYYQSATHAWFVDDIATASIETVASGSISIPSSSTSPQLKFYHRVYSQTGYDGGWLQYKIGAGSWTNALSTEFAQNGYNTATVSGTSCTPSDSTVTVPTSANKIWSATIALGQVIYNIPSGAIGSTIQFRFAFRTDSTTTYTDPDGWWIDNIEVVYSSGSWQATNGYLEDTVTGPSRISTPITWDASVDMRWDFYYKHESAASTSLMCFYLGVDNSDPNNVAGTNGYYLYSSASLSYFYLYKQTGITLTAIITSTKAISTSWHTVKVTRSATGLWTIYFDGTSSGTPVTDTTYTSLSYMGLRNGVQAGTGYNVYVDNIRFGKSGGSSVTSYLKQNVALPSSSKSLILTVWYQTVNQQSGLTDIVGASNDDSVRILARDSVEATVGTLLNDATATGSYASVSYQFATTYAGQIVQVYIEVIDDGKPGWATSVLIDDVSLSYGRGPGTPSIVRPMDSQRGGPNGKRPMFDFSSVDPDSNDIIYHLQIDDNSDMQSTYIDRLSTSGISIVSGGKAELGDMTGWMVDGDAEPYPQRVTAQARNGLGSFQIGDGGRTPTGRDYMWQKLALPQNASAITIDAHYKTTGTTDTTDLTEILIKDTNCGTTNLVSPLNATTGTLVASWTKVTASLTAQKGKEVCLWISFYVDDTVTGAAFFVDDIFVNVTMATTAGFSNIVTSSDTSPFNSGETVRFQSEFDLTDGTVYWWRVRAIDPNDNIWGAWTTSRSIWIDSTVTDERWGQTSKEQFDKDAILYAKTTTTAGGEGGAGAVESQVQYLNLTPTADAFMDSYYPNYGFGTCTYFYTGYYASSSYIARGLLRFDLSSLPSDAVITSSKLYAYKYSGTTTARNYGMHRVDYTPTDYASQWGESTNCGSTATGSGATWNYYRYSTNLWGTAGGNFASSATATTSISATATWYGWELKNDITTFGIYSWLLKDDSGEPSSYYSMFYTKEYGTASYRPALNITYYRTGIATSTTISYADGPSARSGWNQITWNKDVTYGSIEVKVQKYSGSWIDTGISSTSSPIDISSLGTESQIRLVSSLVYSGGSPKLFDWTVSWVGNHPYNEDIKIYLAGDPKAHYRFEEGSGPSAYDASGNGNTGTINGGVTWDSNTPSIYPSYKSMNFDGVAGSYITVSDSPTLAFTNQLTVAAWVKLGSSCISTSFCAIAAKNGEFLLRKDGDNNKAFAFFVNTSGSTWDPRVQAPTAPVTGVWYHVVGTYDGSYLRLYINGTLVNTTARTGSIVDTVNALNIGRWDPTGSYFPGKLDDLRIYNRALSPTEIYSLAGNHLADGTRLYAGMTAEFMVRLTDPQGNTDINYVDLRLNGSTDYVARWTESTDLFSKPFGGSYFDVSSSVYDTNYYGNQWTLWFRIKFAWNLPWARITVDPALYTIDDEANSDTDSYATRSYLLENSLTFRGDPVHPGFVDTFNDLDYTNNPTWTVSAGTWSAATGALESTGTTDMISTPVTFSVSSKDYEWELRWKHESAAAVQSEMRAYLFSSATNPTAGGSGYYFVANSDTSWYSGRGYAGLGWFAGGSSNWLVKTWDCDQLITIGTSWHTAKIRRTMEGLWTLWIDGYYIGARLSSNITTANYIVMRSIASSTSYDIFLDYMYVNRSGGPKVTGQYQGVLTSGASWVRGGEQLTFTGLKVIYQGSSIYPTQADFDVRISDGDAHTWTEDTASGASINVVATADAVTRTTDTFNVDIVNIASGGSDASAEAFVVRIDADSPAVPTTITATPSSWSATNSFQLDWTNASTISSGGLRGCYFDNIDFTNPKLCRLDSTINFNWGTGSPDASVGADTFSVRWTGKVYVQYNQIYTFYTYTSDGVKLWIDGNLIIDKWNDQIGIEWFGSTSSALSIGLHDIRLDYYENTGTAYAILNWSASSLTKQTISSTSLIDMANSDTVVGGIYKLDSVPTSNNDGTWVSSKPINGISVTGDGAHPVYLWLKDSVGNMNYVNRASTTFYLDMSGPAYSSYYVWNGTSWVDPSNWIKDQKPHVCIQVRAMYSGIDNLTAKYYYSINGGGVWTGPLAITGVGTACGLNNAADGSTSTAYLTIVDVPFNVDSGTQNQIKFEVRSKSTVLQTSTPSIIKVDTTPPALNYNSQLSYGPYSSDPPGDPVNVDFSDPLSGLDKVEYRYPQNSTSWITLWNNLNGATSKIDNFDLWNTSPVCDVLVEFRITDMIGNIKTDSQLHYIISGTTGALALYAGANFISVKVARSFFGAFDLGKEIKTKTGRIPIEIMRWDSTAQNWGSSAVSTDGITWVGTNFTINKGDGYIIKMETTGSWPISYGMWGKAITATVGLIIRNGINLLSVPYSSTSYTASTLGDAITSQGGGSTRCYTIMHWLSDEQRYEVAIWNSGWSFSDTDFSIVKGESYFVKVRNGPASWTFTP